MTRTVYRGPNHYLAVQCLREFAQDYGKPKDPVGWLGEPREVARLTQEGSDYVVEMLDEFALQEASRAA